MRTFTYQELTDTAEEAICRSVDAANRTEEFVNRVQFNGWAYGAYDLWRAITGGLGTAEMVTEDDARLRRILGLPG